VLLAAGGFAKNNEMGCHQVDEDFGRGNKAYDNFFGDLKAKPNPNPRPNTDITLLCHSSIPRDIGTKGGDAHSLTHKRKSHGQTLASQFRVCTGNTSALVMEHSLLLSLR
jgi:3-oxosteroid 1-dehydrogenase